MGGNLVEKRIIAPDECLELVEDFFMRNFPEFKLIHREKYTGYWIVKYVNSQNIGIVFEGDIAGVFYIYIIIENTKYPLWNFDKEVAENNFSTRENLLFQLNILITFFEIRKGN